MPDQQAELIAAARAAVSWARTRPATWTEAPLPLLQVTSHFVPAVADEPPPAVVTPSGPSAVARVAGRVSDVAGPVLRKLPRIAAMIALLAGGVAAGVYGGRYLLNAFNTYRTRSVTVERPASAPRTSPTPAGASASKNTGGLTVNSTPTAQVLVDGKPRGVTPVKLTDVSVGRHTIELRSAAGNVQRTVTVEAGKTAEIDESIFSGFLALDSPFEVVVTEGGRKLQFDDRSQTMMAPGHHELRVTNQALGYESVQQFELKPGETTRVTIKPQPTAVTVTANEPAEVWLDGSRIGDAPVNEMPVPLGTHEIVVKRAAGGERRQTITVTVKPITINIDFTK